MFNLVDLNFEDFFEQNPGSRTRGNSKKLYPKKARTSRCLFAFAFGVVNPWNNLPNEAVQSCSLSVFKHKLESLNHVFARVYKGGLLETNYPVFSLQIFSLPQRVFILTKHVSFLSYC